MKIKWYCILGGLFVCHIYGSQLPEQFQASSTPPPLPISERPKLLRRNPPTIVIENSNWDSGSSMQGPELQIQLTSPNGSAKSMLGARTQPSSAGTSPVTPSKASKILGIQDTTCATASKAAKILGMQVNNVPHAASTYQSNSIKLPARSPRRPITFRSSAPLTFTNSDAAVRLMGDIGRGDLQSVQNAIAYGVVNINEPVADFDGQTPFERAIDLNQIDIATYMINHGAHLTRKNRFDQTPAELAIENGRFEIAIPIVEKLDWEDINQKTASGTTLLIEAINSGDKILVDVILKKGADVNAANQDGVTPLIAAVQADNTNAVKLLTQRLAFLDAQDKHGWTALMWAAKENRKSMIDALKKAGANTKIMSFNTKTIVDQLYDENDKLPEEKQRTRRELEMEATRLASLNYNDIRKMSEESSKGNSLRQLAQLAKRKISGAFFSEPSSSKSSLSKEANSSTESTPGELSPLSVSLDQPHTPPLTKASKFFGETVTRKTSDSATDDDYKAFLQYLQIDDLNGSMFYIDNHLIKINEPLPGNAGRTPFELAIDANAKSIVRYMIEHGANINRKNVLYDNQTPLDRALEMGKTDIVLAMLEKSRDFSINMVNAQGETLLYRASMYNNKDVVKFLINKKHADVNIADTNGVTPLMCAAMLGNKDIVKMLLKAGAQVNAQDKKGWTALMWAEKRKKTDIAALLISAHADKGIKSYGSALIFDRLVEQNDRLPEDERKSKAHIEQEISRWASVTYHDLKASNESVQ